MNINDIAIISAKVPSLGLSATLKRTAREVDEENGAESGTSRVTAPKFGKDQEKTFFAELKDLRKKTKDLLYLHTVPWGELRAMNTANGNLEKLRNLWVEKQVEFRTAVRALEAQWDEMLVVGKQKLSGLADEVVYPTFDEFAERFTLADFEVLPANPNAIQFNISGEERDRLIEQGQARVNARIQEASQRLAVNLQQYVANMATMLAKEKPRIYQTLTSNVRDLCDAADSLNLAGDAEVTRLINRARELTTFEIDDLKNDPAIRQMASAQAQIVAADIEQSLNAGRLGVRRLNIQAETQEVEAEAS